MEETQKFGKSELANLTMKDMFFKYIRFLPLFILSVALALFVAFIYLRYATLVYSSIGTLTITDDKKGSSGDKIEQLLASDGRTNIQNEIEYLKSRPLMERVVRSLNMNFNYTAKGKIKELNIYKSGPFQVEAFRITDSSNSFSLSIKFLNNNSFTINNETTRFSFGQVFQNRFGVFRLNRVKDVELNEEYFVTWQPTHVVAGYLGSDLIVAPKIQGTGILNIIKQATNPELAADVINQLMLEYQRAVIEDKNIATSNAIVFIDGRLRVVRSQLDSINRQLLAYQQANNIVDPEAQSSAYLGRIEAANEALTQQSLQLDNAEMITDYLSDTRHQRDPVPTALGLGDPTLTAMIAGYNNAQIERNALLENAPPGNVAVQQKSEEIELIRRKILETLNNLKASYRASINASRSQGGNAQSNAQSMPAKVQIMEDMKRNSEVAQTIYNSLLQKREESAISLASQISNVKVLQEAMPNYTPIKPNKFNFRILAILVGLAIPALFIFILELLNDKVSTRFDIEKITRAPILGEVGHSYGKEALVVTANNRKVVAEQFRILRSNLQYVLTHITKPVILVTSSFSGEGKSFVSTNMGAVMALSGKKTIILEFDIRKPKVLSHMGVEKRPGLTNYLLGKIALEDVPYKVEGYENLFVFPCGPIPPNPSELLLDEKFSELFDYLRATFDVVIMDTAPVGMVSDALTLSKFANCTLYIVRQGHTYKKQIGDIDELYESGKLPKVSLVLNDVKVRSGYGYYGSGRYGYGYGYGYGSGYYEEEEAPPGLAEKWLGWLDFRTWSKKKKTKRTTA